jgi:hypothetical protein
LDANESIIVFARLLSSAVRYAVLQVKPLSLVLLAFFERRDDCVYEFHTGGCTVSRLRACVICVRAAGRS